MSKTGDLDREEAGTMSWDGHVGYPMKYNDRLEQEYEDMKATIINLRVTV